MKVNISGDVREFAKANDLPVGKRGKIALETKVAFLSENTDTARLLAEVNGVEVPARGKLSADSIEAIAKSFA